MRTNSEKQEYTNMDVYSDVDTAYSSHYSEAQQEFSLKEVQEKLGAFAPMEEISSGTASADVMPTQQTLKMSYQRQYQSETAAMTKNVTNKAKVIAISYVAVVLLLVLGIALSAVAVSGVFTETMQLTADYESAVAQVSALEEELATVDYSELAERAAVLGYTNASQSNANTQTYTRVETRPAQNFNIQTNWFDSLCDWLSNVFGG